MYAEADMPNKKAGKIDRDRETTETETETETANRSKKVNSLCGGPVEWTAV